MPDLHFKSVYRGLLLFGALLCSFVGECRGLVGIACDDTSGRGLEYVNVVALRADSSFVAGTVTDSVGRFSLAGDGVRMLNFKLIGYEEQMVDIDNGGASQLTVKMRPKEAILKEVEVTATKPQTRLVDGDMVTMVENTVLANMPTVFEALSFVPMMSVQGESVSVFGKGTPVFYINSRQVRNESDLRALNPSDIVSVRIITNPGARYGSDVKCVVIIKTRKKRGEGFSGWLHEGLGYDGDFSNTTGLYLQYRRDKFEVFTEWFQNNTDNKRQSEHTSDIYTADPIKEDYVTHMRHKNHDANGRLGFSYDVSPGHSLGGFYLLSWGKLKKSGDSRTERFQGGDAEIWNQYEYKVKRTLPSHDANLYYEGCVDKFSISVNIDYKENRAVATDDYFEDGGSGSSRQFSTTTRNSSNLFAENVILSYPARNAEFTLGQEWTKTNYKSRFEDFSGPIGSSRSENDEYTLAVFASWKQRLGRFFLEAGLRYEHRHVKYDGDDDNYRETHDNLFPVVKFGGKHGKLAWNVGYRYNSFPPSYRMMTSDISYVNRFTYQSGNPHLKTMKQQQLYLNLQYRSFWLQSGFNFIDNQIWHVSDIYEPDPNIILQHWMNHPNIKTMYANGGYQTQLGCWRAAVAIGFEKQFLHLDAGKERVNLSKPMFIVSTNHSVELPLGFTIYGRYEMNTERDIAINRVGNCNILSVGISNTFFNGNLMVQLWGKDLLNQQNVPYTSFNRAVVSSVSNDYHTRQVVLMVRYQFNATRSRYKGTGAGAAEKQRL